MSVMITFRKRPGAFFHLELADSKGIITECLPLLLKKLICKSFKKEETNVAHGIGKGMLCFFILTSWRNQERRYALTAIWANYIQYSEAYTAQGIKNQAI